MATSPDMVKLEKQMGEIHSTLASLTKAVYDTRAIPPQRLTTSNQDPGHQAKSSRHRENEVAAPALLDDDLPSQTLAAALKTIATSIDNLGAQFQLLKSRDQFSSSSGLLNAGRSRSSTTSSLSDVPSNFSINEDVEKAIEESTREKLDSLALKSRSATSVRQNVPRSAKRDDVGYKETLIRPTKRVNNRDETTPATPKRLKPEVDYPSLIQAHLTSKKTIIDLIEIFRAFRNHEEITIDFARYPNPVDRACHALELARAFSIKSHLNTFLSRLMQLPLVLAIDAINQSNKTSTTSPKVLGEIITARGEQITPQSRKRLQKELESGRKLRKLCGGKFDGILCFMPLENNGWMSMSDADVLRLHQHLGDSVAPLCKVGLDFQDKILKGEEISIMKWEMKTDNELDALSFEELVDGLGEPL
ncbi:hypothetical protein G7046_g5929 [Stylonectria norvegica]|nr:hypothetical protein G7046_g5929 [Stylonectria norvegica]